jgi:large subunit ribosomal protein L24
MKKKKNCHIKIGDKIQVIAGNQKGLIGNITSINLNKSLVFIDTILARTRYIRNKQTGESEKREIEIPIHISNIMLWDKEINKSSRVGYKLVENNKKRFFKKSGNFV